jgi:hypothetical protein
VQEWREEQPLVIDGRTWLPARTSITIYEGPALTSAQRSFGQAWSNAMQFGENVTSAALDGELPREQESQAPEGQEEASDPAPAKVTLSRYSSVLGALLVVAGGVISARLGVASVPALISLIVVLGASALGAGYLHDRSDRSHLYAFTALLTGCFIWLAIWGAGQQTSAVNESAETRTVALQGAPDRVSVSMKVTITAPAGARIRPGTPITIAGTSSRPPTGSVLWLLAHENNYYTALTPLRVSSAGEWSTSQTLGTTEDQPGATYEVFVVLALNAEQDATYQAAANIYNEQTAELTSTEVTPHALARRRFLGS